MHKFFLFLIVFLGGCVADDPDVHNDTDTGTDIVDVQDDCTNYYKDSDKDGFGAGDPACVASFDPPFGYSRQSTDCNDNDASIHPVFGNEIEADDGVDNDCDGKIDEDHAWAWSDVDHDGFPRQEGRVRMLVKSLTWDFVEESADMRFDCDDNEPRAYGSGLEFSGKKVRFFAQVGEVSLFQKC